MRGRAIYRSYEGKRSMGYRRDHLTPVHRSFRLCEVPPVARCMFPAPTIDSSEYTFGDTVGAAGCSKSREHRRRKVPHARTRFVIARACFIIFCRPCRGTRVSVKIRERANATYIACEPKFPRNA